MAQTGLHIPAMEGSRIAVQKEVYADIGDEQSIEQSLSTFSSHMTNIVSILNSDINDCLILLDELGAGTDPVEGAALAVSILEKLKQTDTLVMATTHYSELKAYAISEEGVQNASMQFDVDKLAPTYRMEIGMPGRSNAFEISKRLGLGEDIIEEAQKHISSDAKKLEDVIYKADAHRKKAHRERVMAEKMRKDTQIYEKRAKEKSDSLDRQKERIIEDAKREAAKIINRAKTQSDTIISELKKAKSSNVDRDIQQARDAMRGLEKSTNAHGVSEKEQKNIAPKNLIPGENVIILDSNTPATVVTIPNAKGEVQVQAGVIKLKTNVKNLKRTQQEVKAPKTRKKGSSLKLEAVSSDLDIRGRNSEEGIMEVDLFLDRAYSSHLKTVNVIHGKGTGILRANIQKHLRSHPHVKDFRLGKYGEGEDGVTVVTLK
jgi:DNA mismatch repair protein MutS2